MNKKVADKSAAISFRLDPQIKADLESLAQQDDRSLANYLQRLLKEHTDGAKRKRRD